MALPLALPLTPMLARLEDTLPLGPSWRYEPKWDGFRTLVVRDGAGVRLWSRNGQDLTRYFPEILPPLEGALPRHVVVDGELVLFGERGLDFDALLQRIHPAASRVHTLAAQTPVSFVAFDLLAHGSRDWTPRPLSDRRAQLEKVVKTGPRVLLTPQTEDAEVARAWFERLEGAGLDGVVAKDAEGPYVPGERVMVKVKHARTADCVVGGYRRAKGGEGIGSLLLGLYDDEGRLLYVGATVSFDARTRRTLTGLLEPLHGGPSFHPDHAPGAPSRWHRGADRAWVSLRPERVCEVAFDHLQGHRFRHATRFLRWRPDKAPRECGFEQLQRPPPLSLEDVAALQT